MKYKILLILLVCFCSSCKKKPIQQRVLHDAGTLISITRVDVDWSEQVKCLIKTDKGIFFVSGYPSGKIRGKVKIENPSSSFSYLYIEQIDGNFNRKIIYNN